MTSIAGNFSQVQARIDSCCRKHERDPSSVRLVAVGKRHPADSVVELARLGQRDFAENYLQEGVEKMEAVRQALAGDDAGPALTWHFIGHIQSRKSRPIAEQFDWVHTVESIKVAEKLDRHRDPARPLNVLVQLNLQEEATKSGVPSNELLPLAAAIEALPNLRFRGLMILPRPESDENRQREVFRRCRHLLEELNGSGIEAGELSMGMTDDMEAAIAEGSTMVRIGTALFGPRPGT